MQYETKEVTKDDGRYLVFYHFPDSAEPEQSEAFDQAEEYAQKAASAAAAAEHTGKQPIEFEPNAKG